MPERIESINQLREFINHYDALHTPNTVVNAQSKKNYNSIVSRLRKRLGVANLEDLTGDIRQIVGVFDRFLAACTAKQGPRVRLGSTHLLSVRLIPSLIKAYHQEMRACPGSVIPRVELVYDMHYRKLDERTFYTAPDLSLTYRAIETDNFEDSVLVDESSHYRCIITRNDNPFAALKDPIERGEFRWECLRDKQVAILEENAAIPNFPYPSIAKFARLLIVRAVIEAHEHVRAGNADIAFTHVDSLTTNELRDFTVIRLNRVAEFGKTRLCLLRSKLNPPSEEQKVAVDTLISIVSNYLTKIEDRHAESARLTCEFNKYKYSYFTSCVRSGSKGSVERRWFRGKFQFEVFVSSVTSEEQPIWFVKAIHDVDGPDGIRQRLFMFGRVRSRNDGGLMSWFGTYSGSDQGSVRITFSHDHFGDNAHTFIEGVSTGRPSWLSKDDPLHIVGAFILHKSPKLSDKALNVLLTQMRQKAKKQYPGTGDPLNPWNLPQV